MSYRTNPDRILDNIDRARNRDAESARFHLDRQAMGRELDTEVPVGDATNPERVKRIFAPTPGLRSGASSDGSRRASSPWATSTTTTPAAT